MSEQYKDMVAWNTGQTVDFCNKENTDSTHTDARRFYCNTRQGNTAGKLMPSST